MPRGRPVSSMNNRQRTPGDVPGAPQYGQGQMMEQASRQIPREPAQPPRPPAERRQARPTAVPLTDPTAFPDEPVTAGAPFGAGAGPASLGQQAFEDNQNMAKYLPALEFMANDPDSSSTLRGYVMYLKGILQ
jgi:hypothetical protein